MNSRNSETVLITGASSGIGAELAKLFAADGSDVVLVARRGQVLEDLAAELRREYSVQATVIACDLTEAAQRELLAEQLAQQAIDVDVLVNNAGFGLSGSFVEHPLTEQLEMIQLNVVALTDLTRRLLPGMLSRRRGAVLNMASTAAFQPGPKMAVYFATKAYVLSLSEALAEETRGTGVTVTCLCPGPTATQFGQRSKVDRTLLFRLGTMSANSVALGGHRALRRGRVLVIPGLVNRLVAGSLRLVPRWVVRRVAALLMTPRDA